MITIYIGGGLANKMFQYAFSLAIKKKGYDICYDVQTFKTEFEHDKITLQNVFPNIKIIESIKKNYWAAGRNDKLSRLWKLISPNYIVEHAYQFNHKVWQQISDNCYIESSWQDERYFLEAENDVRTAFTFAPFKDQKNIATEKLLHSTNSVAIHIRKGDGYGTWNIFANTCTKEYYNNAIKYIRNHVKDPKFFVFTDTPDSINNYLDLNEYTLINWNPTTGFGNHFDMQLMSCAKHNIIANSTYSWWGAWLNNNPNKIVIAPQFWFNPNSKIANINHIIPNKWIKLK